MKRIMVRYKVKEECAEENASLIRDVFSQLKENGPGGIRYAAYKLGDGVSFVHVATIEGENPLVESSAFKAFQSNLKERCAEPPVFEELEEVGAYH